MNLNTQTITDNKSMIKDNKNRTIIVKLIEKEGPNRGKFNITIFDKKTKNSTFETLEKIIEVTRKYDNRDWEPVKVEEKKVKEKKEKVVVDKELVKAQKEKVGDDVVTLKNIIEELIAEKILPESLKMKKVRRILRNHQEELQDKSAKKGEAFRWAWVTSEKDKLKKEISELLK
jgi:protein tyrosine/serine phosphatase